jgi:hypothetical protein
MSGSFSGLGKIILRNWIKRETPVSVNNEHILNQGLNKT